jgi:Flp pilus assembly pilin Flp
MDASKFIAVDYALIIVAFSVAILTLINGLSTIF